MLKIPVTCYFIENIRVLNQSPYITLFREEMKHAVPKAASEFNDEGHRTSPLALSVSRKTFRLVDCDCEATVRHHSS